MTKRAHWDEAAIERVERLAERQLTPDEFRAWADGEISDAEMQDMRSLIEWFLRRYPTPAERLASARQRQRRAVRSIAIARSADR